MQLLTIPYLKLISFMFFVEELSFYKIISVEFSISYYFSYLLLLLLN